MEQKTIPQGSTAARQRIMLIINPISGTGSKKGVPEKVEERLAAAGYQMDKVCCVDMFPHTANCETVVSLTRKK